MTLGELLPGLVETDRLPIQLAPLSTLLANEPRTTTGLLRYTLDLTAPCTLGSASLRLALPDTARYVPGSTRLTVDGTTTTLTDPSGAADASALTFQLTDELTSAPACTGVRTGITVALEVEPPAKLGSPTLEATFTVEGAPYSLRGPTNSASIDDLNDRAIRPQPPARSPPATCAWATCPPATRAMPTRSRHPSGIDGHDRALAPSG